MSLKASICFGCGGKGKNENQKIFTCQYCHGTGLDNSSPMMPNFRKTSCIHCNGTGKKFIKMYTNCIPCGGSGYH